MATVRFNMAAQVICVTAYVLGCGSSEGGQTSESAGASAVAAALPSAKVPLPGAACSARTDGWRPAQVPVSPEEQAKMDRGEPSVTNFPEGYQHRPAKGVPYCVPEKAGTDAGSWAIDCETDNDCPLPARCTVFGDCAVPCSSDSDCVAPERCELGPAEGLKMCRCISCERAGDM